MKHPRKSPLTTLAAATRELLLLPVHIYRRVISPALPNRCKYYPSCSTYAVQAVRELGVVRGSIVAGWRLLRCNPFSHGGYDPLEARKLFRDGGGPGASTGRRRKAAA